MAGQVVRSLVLGHQEAGFYRSRSQAAYWDGRNNQNEQVASGIYQTPRCQGFPSLQETGDVDIAQHLVEKKDLTSEVKCGIIDVDLLDGRSTCRHSKSAVPIRPRGTGRCRLQVIPVTSPRGKPPKDG